MFVNLPTRSVLNSPLSPLASSSTTITVSFSTKSAATSTAPCKKPPGLFLISNITPFTCLASALLTAFCHSRRVSPANFKILMWAIFCPSPTYETSTLDTSIFARTTSISTSSSCPSLAIKRVTLVPAGPRITCTASGRVIPSVPLSIPLASSFIPTIKSPAFSPAFSAGVSGSGAITTNLDPLNPICIPTP